MDMERREQLRAELRMLEKMLLTATRQEAEMLYGRKAEVEHELEPGRIGRAA